MLQCPGAQGHADSIPTEAEADVEDRVLKANLGSGGGKVVGDVRVDRLTFSRGEPL